MRREWKEALWEMYLEGADYLQDKKEQVRQIGKQFFDDVSFLYEISPLIGSKGRGSEDARTGFLFGTGEDGMHFFRSGGDTVSLNAEEARTLTADMTGLFEEILPIGSIVDLKKEVLGKNMDVSQIENFRLAVVKRFMAKGERYYYPYGAAVYPVGNAGKGKLLSFTPALIEKVLFTGYSDETEEAFIFQMKQELIIRQHRMSAGFAEREEEEVYE